MTIVIAIINIILKSREQSTGNKNCKFRPSFYKNLWQLCGPSHVLLGHDCTLHIVINNYHI